LRARDLRDLTDDELEHQLAERRQELFNLRFQGATGAIENTARLKLAKRDALVMHPGPIIRGLELTWEVADCPQSVIVEEVRNGVPVRMAILAKALGRAR